MQVRNFFVAFPVVPMSPFFKNSRVCIRIRPLEKLNWKLNKETESMMARVISMNSRPLPTTAPKPSLHGECSSRGFCSFRISKFLCTVSNKFPLFLSHSLLLKNFIKTQTEQSNLFDSGTRVMWEMGMELGSSWKLEWDGHWVLQFITHTYRNGVRRAR